MNRYWTALAWALLALSGAAMAAGGLDAALETGTTDERPAEENPPEENQAEESPTAEDPRPAMPPTGPVLLERPRADPARRARLVAWWRQYEAARPALSVVLVRLRRERARWHEGSSREGCRVARRALAEVDAAALQRGVDYMLVQEIGTALDEFDGAALACLERRYFEFDYRLRLAEEALVAARKRAAAQLARPVE